MERGEKLSYLKKHIKELSRGACAVAKEATMMFFDTKGYNDNFLRENGEPTMDEYAEIMRKHDLIEEKARGYYFGNVENVAGRSRER